MKDPENPADLKKLEDEIKGLKEENKILEEKLELYKDEVENMVEILGKIEGQVEGLEKENDDLAEDLDNQNKQLDSERESFKDLKEQYLDQIEINNKRNKEIIMLKNQISRKNDIGGNYQMGKGGIEGEDPEKVQLLEAEVMDKNEVINMLKGDIRDKENQKSHLSQKIRDLEVLFRDMERENQELRKLKEIGKMGEGEGEGDKSQLYVQVIRQQQLELKKWRASQLTPEEVPKLQIIIQDQHKEILQLKSRLEAEGKPIPQVNQAQLMEVIRKQQAEINRLKTLGGSDQEGENGEKQKQLIAIIKQQQEELVRLRKEKINWESGNPRENESEKIQQLMKVVKQHQDQNEDLRRQLQMGQEDPEKDAKLAQYVQVIKQQQNELIQLRTEKASQGNGLGREHELQNEIDSKNDEIFFLKKKLNQGGVQVNSGNPGIDDQKYMDIINGQNQELEGIKGEIARLHSENEHLRQMGQGQNPNMKNMMQIIQKQQDELNNMRMRGQEGNNGEELMQIIKRQQDELNQLRLLSARNDKVEDLMMRLKEKQDEINRLRMENAGQQTNENLIKMVKEKQEEINKLRLEKGNQGSVERLMQLLKEKQEEINDLRMNRRGKNNNEKLMKMLKEKQEEINKLRLEKAQGQNSEELKRIIQEKQQEINKLKNSGGLGKTSENLRKEIELQNEISRLKPFESRSNQLDSIVNDLEKKVFELQTANPEMANAQRLGDIIKTQQEDLNRLKSQLGGRDWVRETEKLKAIIQKIEPENRRLKLNLKEIQNVNKSNKEIYLHEKETLQREIHTLQKEVEIREERIVETHHHRNEEMEAELNELRQMVNNIVGGSGEYEEKYREQKAINANWRQKAQDYDNLKQLYEQKLLENEAKIIRLNNLELKIFVLMTQLRTRNQNVKSNPAIYKAPNRFQKRTASPNVHGGYRKSSPSQQREYSPNPYGPRGSNPLQKRVGRDSFRNGSPSPNKNYMVVTNNDGTFTKQPVHVSSKTVSRKANVQHNTFTSTSVNETRTREVNSMQR